MYSQAGRLAQVHCVLKPSGVQQVGKGTELPLREADQAHTLLSLANLPAGSSSFAAQPKSHQVGPYTCAPYSRRHESVPGAVRLPTEKLRSHAPSIGCRLSQRSGGCWGD